MNGHDRGYHQEQRGFSQLQNGMAKMPEWIKTQVNKEAIDFAEKFGKYLADQRFTNSQIRNIFGEIKRLQMKKWDKTVESSLLLLKPKLAYSAKRQMGRQAENAAIELKDFLCKGIDIVIDSEDQQDSFEHFANIFEAILAYHKAHGGK